MLKTILSIVLIILCIFIIGIVLFQEGNSQGLGAIGGMADSYWGRNKAKSLEGMLGNLTKIAAVLFFVIALAINVIE